MKERLAEIKARCEKATKGPWSYDNGEVFGADGGGIVETGCGYMPDVPMLNGSPNWQDRPEEEEEANADLITNAREDIPWLISQVEALTERLRSIQYQPNGPCEDMLCLGCFAMKGVDQCTPDCWLAALTKEDQCTPEG